MDVSPLTVPAGVGVGGPVMEGALSWVSATLCPELPQEALAAVTLRGLENYYLICFLINLFLNYLYG